MNVHVILAALIACAGCSGSQHTWQTSTDAALSTAAHAIDTADAIAAQRYTAEASLPGANLDALDARYASLRTARTVARERMIAAEHALAGGGCDAVTAVRLARLGLIDVGEALEHAGVDEAPAVAAAVSSLAGVLSSGPACPGGQ